MATQTQVKNYLAYWFQLGKQVVADDGQTAYLPKTVIQGDRFSPEFEQCWQNILQGPINRFHLEGTDQTIADLLSSGWEISNCSRCDMLVPTPEIVTAQVLCPCNDLPTWPNEELPKPRLPINSEQHLNQVKERLMASFKAD
ncbi:MAG: hypothetical protein AAFQ95_11815 [Cyanobacteria bacterium J06621_3]